MSNTLKNFDIPTTEIEDLTVLGGIDNQESPSDFLEDAIGSIASNDGDIGHSEEPAQEEQQEEIMEEDNLQPDNSWFFALSNVPKFLKIVEYDQTYIFSRIVDPQGNYSNKFNVFFKEGNIDDANWITLNGVLTDRYVAASLEKFIEVVTSGVNLIGEPVIKREPWKSIWFGKTDTNIQYFDDETSGIVFSLITGVDLAVINNLSSNLSIVVSNSYDGKRSLRLDYNINTSGSITVDGQLQEVNIVDYFSLGKFSHNVNHTTGLAEVSTDLTSIQNNVTATINTLKNYRTNLNDIIESISSSFKKEARHQFNSLCENLVDDYRSLYYVLILASVALSNNYSVSEHMVIRSKIDNLYRRVFRP